MGAESGARPIGVVCAVGWYPHTVDPAVLFTDGGVRVDFRTDAPITIRAYAEHGARRLSWKVWKGDDVRKPLV